MQGSKDGKFPKMVHEFPTYDFSVDETLVVSFDNDLIHMTQHPSKIDIVLKEAMGKYKKKSKTQQKLKLLINVEKKVAQEIVKNENVKQWDIKLWGTLKQSLKQKYAVYDIRKCLRELGDRALKYKTRTYSVLVQKKETAEVVTIGKTFLYFVSKNCEKEICRLQQKNVCQSNAVTEGDLVKMLKSEIKSCKANLKDHTHCTDYETLKMDFGKNVLKSFDEMKAHMKKFYKAVVNSEEIELKTQRKVGAIVGFLKGMKTKGANFFRKIFLFVKGTLFTYVLVGVLGLINLVGIIVATVLSKTQPDLSIFIFFGIFFGMLIGGELDNIPCIKKCCAKKGIQ